MRCRPWIPRAPGRSRPSLSPKRIWRVGERVRVRGGHLLECRQELGSWRWALACEQAAAPHPRPASTPASALSPELAGERGTVATFPSPPSAFGARGERVRVRGGYLLECRQELGSWRWALACEQAAAPHPRPARTPASALSPEGAGERGTVATFPSPPSAFGAWGERVRVRGGYLLECRQELGSWRWALACEQAAAPHPRPARTPASALSPELAGERGTVAACCRSTRS